MDIIYKWLETSEDIVYYDFETTGLNQYHDKIIEYAFFKESDKTEISGLIDPEIPISMKIQKITNITNEMVSGKPKMWQVLPKIISFLQEGPNNKYLVAHNNDGFDRIFLQNQLKKYDYNCQSFDWKYIDTLLLAKKLLPNLSSYSLKALLIYFKLPPMNTHRALDDTKVLRLLYHELCKILTKKINLSYEDIINSPSSVYKYLYC